MRNSGTSGTVVEAKRLSENLLSDLRTLSTEARKKHSQVKEAAESGLVKIKNITAASNDNNLLTNLRLASAELLQPLILGCVSKNARLVQISLQAIQKMVQHRVIDPASAHVIVNELWHLMEAECEELRILQTLTPLVSTELLVSGPWLAKCLVMCFRLNFAKDPIVINTASATVRQIISCVYERIIQEDSLKGSEMPVVHHMSKAHVRVAPPTLRPCALDGFMLFNDLCLLINAEAPIWLVGIQEMTRTLGLELLESVLASYPSIFIQHSEFAQLLKDQVCPLIVKLFAPNHKQMQVVALPDLKMASQHPFSSNSKAAIESSMVSQLPISPERPCFPISMRLMRVVVILVTQFYKILVTECEIFLSLLVKFLECDKLGWQRAIALEVLHRIIILPDLLMWFSEHYDNKINAAKVMYSVMSALASFIQMSFLRAEFTDGLVKDEDQPFESSSQPSAQPGFLHHGVWVPFCANIMPKKMILLDSLEKHEAANLPEGYCLSLAYHCITDCCQSISESADMSSQKNEQQDVMKELFQSIYSSLLVALSLLLDASTDEKLTSNLLECLMKLTSLSCLLDHTAARDAALFSLCKIALPHKYLLKVIGGSGSLSAVPRSLLVANETQDKEASKVMEKLSDDAANGQLSHVVAVGTTCPTPSMPSCLSNTSVMLTAKNIQVSRALITCAEANGSVLSDCWHLILTTMQHLVWIMGMTPNPQGGFRTDRDTSDGSALISGSGTNVLTAAAMTEVPVMAAMLNKLFDSTAKFDDVALHHVIAALCKLSSEAMIVAQNGNREPSFFPVAKLQQTGMVNLNRMEVFWKPVTAHLIEIASHPHSKLREWGAQALTTLIKNSLKSKSFITEAKRQQLILSPLLSVCEIAYTDVRRKQIDCLMNVLQSAGQQLTCDQWPTVIEILGSIVGGSINFDEALIKQSYEAVALIVADFLEILPFGCMQMLVETDAKYGSQQYELNISLSALGQLWTISDFVYRKSTKLPPKDSRTIWLVLYNCLSELCVDPRPPVRKSACQTLLQTIASHGSALDINTWSHMVWKILFPMLDKVRALTRSASTTRTGSAALGASNLLIHHSRDTELKQWAETSVQTLSGVVKIFNVQRASLFALDDFPSIWATLLKYIEYLSAYDNSEMSLAALKNFQELLLGKILPHSFEASRKEKSKLCRTAGSELSFITSFDETSCLTENLSIMSWQTWIRIARSLVFSSFSSKETSSSLSDRSDEITETIKSYVPGPSQLVTLLQTFMPLFDRVRKKIPCEVLGADGVCSIFRGIIILSSVAEQASFLVNKTSEVSPMQEAVLTCLKIVFQDIMEAGSNLRPVLPDVIRLMVDFSLISIKMPTVTFANKIDSKCTQNMVPFAELSMRLMVEFYASTAHFQEIIHSAVLVDIIKCLSQPLELKYQCPSQSTWKAAASALVTVLRLGLPIARQNPHCFTALWDVIPDALERFLFNNNRPSSPLNADERKRHEFIDCQFIELIRCEILPYTSSLPNEFIQRIIELLNRGSISAIDSNDVLALDSYTQRAELCKVCFDALLSMSQSEEQPDIIRSTSPSTKSTALVAPTRNVKRYAVNEPARISNDNDRPPSLGSSAIASLLIRCEEVMSAFSRDELNTGQLPLCQERIIEMISVLHAISTLNEGIVRHAGAVNQEFYNRLVSLYPVLVNCVPSARADSQVEQSLIVALKSYQNLLLMQSHH